MKTIPNAAGDDPVNDFTLLFDIVNNYPGCGDAFKLPGKPWDNLCRNVSLLPLRERMDCVADARQMRRQPVEPYPSPPASLLPLPQGERAIPNLCRNVSLLPLREKVDCVADARRMRGQFQDEMELVEPYPSPPASLLPLPQGERAIPNLCRNVSLLPLREKVDCVADARRMRGDNLRRAPHPARCATFSLKGRREIIISAQSFIFSARAPRCQARRQMYSMMRPAAAPEVISAWS
jgi:hypothetical protein